MANVITVNKLAALCLEQIKSGNGDKKILLSSDDEGNEYHEMFFGFTPQEEIFGGHFPPMARNTDPIEEYIVLG